MSASERPRCLQWVECGRVLMSAIGRGAAQGAGSTRSSLGTVRKSREEEVEYTGRLCDCVVMIRPLKMNES